MFQAAKKYWIPVAIIVISFIAWSILSLQNIYGKSNCRELFFGSRSNYEIFQWCEAAFFVLNLVWFKLITRFFNKVVLFIVFELIIIFFVVIQYKIYLACH